MEKGELGVPRVATLGAACGDGRPTRAPRGFRCVTTVRHGRDVTRASRRAMGVSTAWPQRTRDARVRDASTWVTQSMPIMGSRVSPGTTQVGSGCTCGDVRRTRVTCVYTCHRCGPHVCHTHWPGVAVGVTRVTPPSPRQPGTSTGQRATPTRVTPGDTGHSKGSGEATGRAPGGCKARHAPTRVYGTYPRGRTRGGRTWDRRGAPPACGRWCGSGPASGWKARGPRARKRSVGTRVRLACAKPVPCHREGGRTVGRTNPPSRPPHHQKQPQGLPRTPYVLSMF